MDWTGPIAVVVVVFVLAVLLLTAESKSTRAP
jgi:hypothetical protein